MFFEILALKTKGIILVEQSASFGDIRICLAKQKE
jgi:hypothetical protein